MATNGARIRTEQGIVTGDIQRDQTPQCFFNEADHVLAFKWNPRLYCQIMEEHVSFDHIAKAWWIANDPDDPVGKDEKRASQFLEYLARRKFSEQHGSIEKDYWNKKPTAGCALTGDGYVHSVMNITDPELVLYEDRVHQLCRDVHRTFGRAAAHPATAKAGIVMSAPRPTPSKYSKRACRWIISSTEVEVLFHCILTATSASSISCWLAPFFSRTEAVTITRVRTA